MARATALQHPDVAQALREYVLAVADDELILGHRHSEWTGLGPDIESDVALSSIAQEEMGHARLFYQQPLALGGQYEDHLDAVVFDRPPEAFRNVVLLERPNGAWGFTILRLVLYELADAVRLEVLSHSPLETLPALARTLQREEKYHRMYGETWLDRLARATPDSHAHVQAALDAVWSEALGLFEPTPGGLDLRLPGGPAAAGGRRGEHSPDLVALLDEMTEVRRLEPGVKW